MRVGLSLPEELLGRVDAARGDVPRSAFMRRALEKALVEGPEGIAAAGPVIPHSAAPTPPRAPEKSHERPSANFGSHERYGPRRPRPKGVS